MAEQVNGRGVADHHRSASAKAFTKSEDSKVWAHAELGGEAASLFTIESKAVRFVDDEIGAIAPREALDLLQGRFITIH